MRKFTRSQVLHVRPRIDRRVPVRDLDVQALRGEVAEVHARREFFEADDRMNPLANLFLFQNVANRLHAFGQQRRARCCT